MGLAEYQQETRAVQLKGGSFEVRGLSLTDITDLVRYHLPDLEAFYALGAEVMQGKKELDETDIGKLVVSICEQAPGFVANLIAIGAGEGKNQAAIDNAYKLPVGIQIKIVMDIADLTFMEVGGVKKGLESVAGLLKMTKRVVPQGQQVTSHQ